MTNEYKVYFTRDEDTIPIIIYEGYLDELEIDLINYNITKDSKISFETK